MVLPLTGNRLLIAGLASTGAIETGYLTLSHFSSTPVSNLLCSSQATTSCNDVLNGPYSVIPMTDIPLSSAALLAYTTVAALSLMHGRIANRNTSDAIGSLLLSLTTAMATFSAYLMFILNFVVHGSCNYCMLSAFISFCLAGIVWNEKLVSNLTKAFTISATSSVMTTALSAFIFYLTTSLAGSEAVQASTAPAAQVIAQLEAQAKNIPPTITKSSSPEALKIAARLKKNDAKMYGAYWCSHCFNQKQELGQEAFHDSIPYIECDKEGKDSQFKLCREKKIPGYPTWEIGGQFFPGEQSLKELNDILVKVEGLQAKP